MFDELDRAIINRLQGGFPLCDHPYAEVAQQLGTSEGELLDVFLDARLPVAQVARRLALENQLDDLLLPWKIDIVLFDKIDNPALRDHIDRVGIPFSAA